MASQIRRSEPIIQRAIAISQVAQRDEIQGSATPSDRAAVEIIDAAE
jgi:hypothetical protein